MRLTIAVIMMMATLAPSKHQINIVHYLLSLVSALDTMIVCDL